MDKTKVVSLPDPGADFVLDPGKLIQEYAGEAGAYAGEVGGAFGVLGGRFGALGEDGEEGGGGGVLSEFYSPGEFFDPSDFFDAQSIVDEAFSF